MSKKAARTIDEWGGGATRRRRRVRPHVLKAARRAFALVLVGIPAGFFLFRCLCHFAEGAHVGPASLTGGTLPRHGSSWIDAHESPGGRGVR